MCSKYDRFVNPPDSDEDKVLYPINFNDSDDEDTDNSIIGQTRNRKHKNIDITKNTYNFSGLDSVQIGNIYHSTSILNIPTDKQQLFAIDDSTSEEDDEILPIMFSNDKKNSSNLGGKYQTINSVSLHDNDNRMMKICNYYIAILSVILIIVFMTIAGFIMLYFWNPNNYFINNTPTLSNEIILQREQQNNINDKINNLKI